MFGNRRHFRILQERSEDGIASNILADRLRRRMMAERDDHLLCGIPTGVRGRPTCVRSWCSPGGCCRRSWRGSGHPPSFMPRCPGPSLSARATSGSGRDVSGGGHSVANHGNEISPAPDDLAVSDSVDDQFLDSDLSAGGCDAVEESGMRPLTDQSRGDRILLDDQFLQLPVIVRETGAYSLHSLDIGGQSIHGSGPAHLLVDELAQLIEAALVAAGEVPLVPGGYVSAFESHRADDRT